MERSATRRAADNALGRKIRISCSCGRRRKLLEGPCQSDRVPRYGSGVGHHHDVMRFSDRRHHAQAYRRNSASLEPHGVEECRPSWIPHSRPRLGFGVLQLVLAHRLDRTEKVLSGWTGRGASVAIVGVEQLAVLDDALEISAGQM